MVLESRVSMPNNSFCHYPPQVHSETASGADLIKEVFSAPNKKKIRIKKMEKSNMSISQLKMDATPWLSPMPQQSEPVNDRTNQKSLLKIKRHQIIIRTNQNVDIKCNTKQS